MASGDEAPYFCMPSAAMGKRVRKQPYGPTQMEIIRKSYIDDEIGYRRIAQKYP